MQATGWQGPGRGLTHSHTLPPKSCPSLWPKLATNWGPRGVWGTASTIETFRHCKTRRTTIGIVETQPPRPPDGAWGQTAPTREERGRGLRTPPRAQFPASASHLGGSPAAPGAPQTAAPALATIPGEEGRQKPGHWPPGASPVRAFGPTQIRGPHHPGARSPGRDASACRGPQAPLLCPSDPSLPAALRTTRCSAPWGPEAARVTTATATQNTRTQAGAIIAGAGATAFSGEARGHAAPHGPALAPAGGGRRSGVCGRRQAARYPGRLAPAASSRRGPSLLPPSLPGCCTALPGRRRPQTFQSGKPAPRPGLAVEIARDPGPPGALAPPRAHLDPTVPARPPRTDLAAAGAQLAARGPCFGSLLAGPAPAPRPFCRRFAGASVRRAEKDRAAPDARAAAATAH